MRSCATRSHNVGLETHNRSRSAVLIRVPSGAVREDLRMRLVVTVPPAAVRVSVTQFDPTAKTLVAEPRLGLFPRERNLPLVERHVPFFQNGLDAIRVAAGFRVADFPLPQQGLLANVDFGHFDCRLCGHNFTNRTGHQPTHAYKSFQEFANAVEGPVERYVQIDPSQDPLSLVAAQSHLRLAVLIGMSGHH